MNNFIFENGTKTFFGRGCVKEYLGCLTGKYGDTVMLAYGGGSIKKSGVYGEVTGILAAVGKTVVEFPGITANPTYQKVREGAALAREKGVDLILGVGGGSVMDCCKAVSMAAVYAGDIWDDFWARPGVVDFQPLPLGVIVTTAGTGSGMNGGALITNGEKLVKRGRDDPAVSPRFALMDPTYTYSVSKFQLASDGFGILSNIMDAYFSACDAENVSDDLSEALMRGVIRDLRASLADPEDYNARSNLMWESAMAGSRILKLGKKCDFQCRQMGHQLCACTGCGHGAGLAVLQPVYYRHIYPSGLSKFKRFAVRVWGIDPAGKSDEETAAAGVEALAGFIREIGLPTTLRELGIAELPEWKAVADSCALAPGSYRKMTHEEIDQIFQEAL